MTAQTFRQDLHTYKWAFIYCAIASLGAMCYGYDNTYYTGVLGMTPFINSYGKVDNKGVKALTVSFTSLTASSIYIGDTLGALISAPINDKFGRKAVFWCASFCILGGGIAQVADNGNEGVIIFGRILIGLGVGQFTTTSLLYMGEVAPTQVRGPALMMFQFLQSCSQLVASGISQGTESRKDAASYRIPMGGLVILPLILFATLPFIPETPFWYFRKGRKSDAERSLRKIYQSKPDYDPAMDMILLAEQERLENEHSQGSSWLQLINDPIERRKLVFSCGAMFAQQINGILFFYVYGVIFAQAIGISQPFLISLITNVLQIVAVGCSVVLGNKVRRRPNMLITKSMMVFAFIVIGGIGTEKTLNKSGQYVIVVFSYIIICAFNFGPGPLAFTIAREMAIGRNQNKIMSAAIVTFFVTIWLVSFTAPYLYYTANLGPMLGFVYAGTTALISMPYSWFCVGETAGRSLAELGLFFEKKIPVRQWRGYRFSEDELPSMAPTNTGHSLHTEHIMSDVKGSSEMTHIEA